MARIVYYFDDKVKKQMAHLTESLLSQRLVYEAVQVHWALVDLPAPP